MPIDETDPWYRYLLQFWCDAFDLDPEQMEAFREGREEMAEGFAASVTVASKGLVPITYWPRVRSDFGIAARALPPKQDMQHVAAAENPEDPQDHKGRPHLNPDSKFVRYLQSIGLTFQQYAPRHLVTHQTLSMRALGQRAAPIEFVRAVEEESKPGPGKPPAVPFSSWPKVLNKKTKERWEYGRPVKEWTSHPEKKRPKRSKTATP